MEEIGIGLKRMIFNKWLIIISVLLIIIAGIFFIPKTQTVEIEVSYPQPFEGQNIEEQKKVSILAFGDMMLDRSVFLETKKAGDFNHPLLFLDDFLKDVDLTIANLEGPITNNKSISTWGNEEQRMKFTISPDFLEPLSNYFNILNLANNHMQDFGENGYEQSKTYLAQAGIGFFGDLKNRVGNISKIIDKNGIKTGLIGYHDLYFKNLPIIIEEIKKAKQEADFVIVFPHWGVEYQKEPSNTQREEARMFIDAGADLILGSHPHVIQPIEIYQGNFIFYSLGNFIFDQYFSQETMEGLAIKIFLEKHEDRLKFFYQLIPFTINKKSQPELTDEEAKIRILNELSNISDVDEDIKKHIREGLIGVE